MKPIAPWGISALLSLNFAIGLQAQILTPNGGLDGSSGNQNVAIGFNGQPAEKLVVEDGGNSPGVLHVRAKTMTTFQGPVAGPDHAFKITHDIDDPMIGQSQNLTFKVRPTGKTEIGIFPISSPQFLAVSGSFGLYQGGDINNYIHLQHTTGNAVPELTWRSPMAHNFVFRDGGTGNGVLYLSPDGKVGVGTEDFADNHKLYVDGSVYITDNGPEVHSLWVEGSILTEELTVMAKGNWPDYVFEPSYALMPLTEVGHFIKAYGHLPGMPTATQVAEEGVAVGETQRLLTEKVEELTLYLLQMNKEMEALREEITTLRGEK